MFNKTIDTYVDIYIYMYKYTYNDAHIVPCQGSQVYL